MQMMRCLVDRIDIAFGEVTESIWKHHEVDFDRELKPGFTVGDAVAGREDCFEPVDGGLSATTIKDIVKSARASRRTPDTFEIVPAPPLPADEN